jgi:hypothetical protein
VSAGFDGGDVYLYGKGRFNTSSQRNTASINDWASILDKKMLIVRIPGCVPLLMVQEAALDRHPVTEVPVFTTFAIWRAQRLQLTSRWRILNTAVLHRTCRVASVYHDCPLALSEAPNSRCSMMLQEVAVFNVSGHKQLVPERRVIHSGQHVYFIHPSLRSVIGTVSINRRVFPWKRKLAQV